MAEKTILVCDVCGKPAAETVTIKVTRGNYVKDMCAMHVNELVGGARRPRRGRPRAVVGGSAPKKPAARKATAPRKTTSTAKRRGRPRKKAA